jgi:putative acetyltransferase
MLFEEYANSLGFNLQFQDFEKEYTKLPGEYALPAGRLLLARCNDMIAGCAALRKIDSTVCEMKRMYVRPQFRGKKIGRQLSLRLIEEARLIGYEKMRLDTVPSMVSAIALYRSLGFKEIAPYRYNPLKGAKFMELQL